MIQELDRITSRLRVLITIACIIAGLLAGGDIYRYVIEVPAWRHLNIVDWATYSRHADLGNGIYLFPIEAIGSAILLITASIIVLSKKPAFITISWPLYMATFFSLAGLFLTVFAAPIMLNLRKTANDPEFLQQTFNRFHFWGLLRTIAQSLSFFASVWALGKRR